MARTTKILERMAKKYIWWKSVDAAMTMPERIIAQVMDIGDYDDVQILANAVGEDILRDTLTHAQAGQFSERSWAYWHYRLGLSAVEKVPELPRRKFG